MPYQPRPVDTSGIRLDPELVQLTEALARNAHEVWAAQRLAAGWRYGPQRNDQKQENPCLVPYGDLPDSEKAVDRALALETLKVIQALGYRISKS